MVVCSKQDYYGEESAKSSEDHRPRRDDSEKSRCISFTRTTREDSSVPNICCQSSNEGWKCP